MKKKIVALLVLIACFDIISAYMVVTQEMAHLQKENGFLENMQALLLAVTVCVFLIQPVISTCYHRIFSWAGAFLCFAFFLREVEVEDFDLPAIVIMLGSGVGRNVFLASVGVALFVYFIVRFQTIKVFLPRYFFEKSSLLFLAGLVFLVLGGLFDKKIIDVVHCQLFEEILEVTGYYLMLIGAVIGCSCRQ
jgi:hypothetical protein